MIFVFVIVGAFVGAILFDGEGIIPGLIVGFLAYRAQEARDEIKKLSTKVSFLEGQLKEGAPPAEGATVTILAQDAASVSPPVVEIPVEEATEEAVKERSKEKAPIDQPEEPVFEPAPTVSSPEDEPIFTPPPPRRTRTNEFFVDDTLGVWINYVKAFFLEGNLFGRLGVLVLFVGFSFLVKEAVQQGFFPIELRLAAAFLVGAVMIFLGWRLTKNRPGYGLTLQGGGIAILYLTVFAGFRLYELISPQFAFSFLVMITILGTVIALLQNAQSLAVISLLGGFLAPVVTSTGEGNHVALFSYYAVLNAGVFFMAWKKPWRAVNLAGFFSTFAIGTMWGGLSYDPTLFNTTEPFLILFFLIYFSISLMYAMRHGLEPKKIVDGTLVFGLPVIAFTLQAVLVEPFEYVLAFSALVMGACYGIAAWFIQKHNPALMRTLTEALAGISLALLSMTIPFALDATWTGAGWALEGAALIWLGVRQKRILVRLGGLVLTILASASFLYGFQETSYDTFQTYRFVLNPAFMGFVALSFSALFAAFQIEKNKDQVFTVERIIAVLFIGAGLLWWTIGGIEELKRALNDPHQTLSQLTFVCLSASGLALFGSRQSWTFLVRATLFLIPAVFFFVIVSEFQHTHAFVSWGVLAWTVAFASLYFVLYLNEGMREVLLGLCHAATFWLLSILLTLEVMWLMKQQFDTTTIWPSLSVFLIPLLLIGLVVRLSQTANWPVALHKKAYLQTAIIPVLLGLWLISMQFSFDNAGNPTPLVYLPVLNPVDIVLGLSGFIGLFWYKAIQQAVPDFGTPSRKRMLKWTAMATLFIWMNATIGRTVHHWADIPYTDQMLNSSVFLTALSICWTLLALTVMTYAARRGARTPWFVAAGLLALVLIKLAVVDFSNLNTLHRVISFIGVGLLLLIIGYIAPVPPKNEESFSQFEGS